ncbi:MAG: hypothetical protein AAGC65_14525, partial [Mucilaginibacter sp.]|uniref:hypothetical protein n=1 Tax=Mucilaginibacter sp. TaxID=1882438 RepID=UPI0031A4A227
MIKTPLTAKSVFFKVSTTFASLCILVFQSVNANAQTEYELNSGWKCSPIGAVKDKGAAISQTAYSTNAWMPAVVPGTV